jgi:hypothetical protein
VPELPYIETPSIPLSEMYPAGIAVITAMMVVMMVVMMMMMMTT